MPVPAAYHGARSSSVLLALSRCGLPPGIRRASRRSSCTSEAQSPWRCRWSAAEAALADGDRAEARRDLHEVEAWADAHGHAALTTRARRSLRRAGVRRSARTAGTARDALTSREWEVLGLVRAGLRRADIATRLGIAVTTVDSHVASARRKLGARSRANAASLLDAPRE